MTKPMTAERLKKEKEFAEGTIEMMEGTMGRLHELSNEQATELKHQAAEIAWRDETIAGHEEAMRDVDKYLDDLGHPEDDRKGRRTLRARLEKS